MSDTVINQNLNALNLHMLLVLRDLVLRDLPLACQQFGVSKEVAQQIADTPINAIKEFADCDVLLFRPAFSSQMFDRLLNLPKDLRPAFMAISGADGRDHPPTA